MSLKRSLLGIIQENLFKGKTLLIFGARRVGKTHLVKQLSLEYSGAYFNGELLETQELLSQKSREAMKAFIGNHRIIILDEAQAIPDIGQKLKILHDTFPEVQVIATGSSAFELMHAMAEPLTGRSRTFHLFPFSFREITDNLGYPEAYAAIESILRYGSYPEVFQKPVTEKQEELMNIASNYLYKDILTYGNLKRPDIIHELLKHLAFQIGKEVSLNELSNKTDTSVHTIKRYLELLEQTFVLTSLHSFSRNLRNELAKARKYYFNDLGMRNAVINNFSPLSLRNDTGQLWENFCVIERMKKNAYARKFANFYFWRTYDQKEIDLIEEFEGNLHAFEFKLEPEKARLPKAFADAYPASSFQVISKADIATFLLS